MTRGLLAGPLAYMGNAGRTGQNPKCGLVNVVLDNYGDPTPAPRPSGPCPAAGSATASATPVRRAGMAGVHGGWYMGAYRMGGIWGAYRAI